MFSCPYDHLSELGSVVHPERGSSVVMSYVCILESFERAKRRPAVTPEPGVMLVIPRALLVPLYRVGSSLDKLAGEATRLIVGSWRVDLRFTSRYLRSHCRKKL